MRKILAAIALIVGGWWAPAAFAQVPPGGGGGSGGDVTCSSVPCATATNQTKVQSTPGTPQTTAVTIQGNAGGVPVPVSGTFSGTIGGFAPASVGTPIAVTTGGVTGTLPAGTTVVATNVGATNAAYCALGASSTTSQQYIAPSGGWFAFTVGGNTQLTCITSTSTTTVNMVGGSGLATGTGGGSGGSGAGGNVTVVGPLGTQSIGGSVATTTADGAVVTLGAEADAACSTDIATCTAEALYKRINQRLTSLIAAVNAAALTPPLATKPGTTGTGAYSAATVGTSDSTILAAATATVFLDIQNVSNTATICINMGTTATISGTQCAAGEIVLPPGWKQSWETSFIPTDAVHAIASAASTQATIGVK